jgi:antitoxin component YwqK of YwqJK toxin-antitoxin module
MKYLVFLFALLLFGYMPIDTLSQCSLSGITIVDDPVGKFPIGQIQVSLLEMNETVFTNNDGKFVISDIKPAKYKLKIIKDGSSILGVLFKNLIIDNDIELDTLFLLPFYAPIRDLTLGGFGKDVKSMKEYYKDKGVLIYDTSQYNYYSHGYYCGKLLIPVKDSIDHYYRQGEWKWEDRNVFFDKGILNGPTKGYYASRKCGYTGYYKNDELDGLWEFYCKNTNEVYQVKFEEGYLIADLDTISIKDFNRLIKKIIKIYQGIY